MIFNAVSCVGKNRVSESVADTVNETDAVSTSESVADTTDETDAVSAAPLMWRVTDKDGHTLYLFGTIHVGDERNDAVMKRVAPVLESCDALAVEFDVVTYETDTQRMINDMIQYVLPLGSTVSDYMPEELYNRSYELIGRAGLTPSVFRQYNLAWWAQLVDTAMLMIYSDLDSGKAMDSLLIKHANKKGIPVLEVESSGFQMTMLNSFDNELYLMQIEDSLNNAESYNDELTKLYGLWLSGDRDAFWSYLENGEGDTEDGQEYTEEQIAMIEDYNRTLMDDRNVGMCDKALEYLKSGQTVFFAVGSAHMANEKGLVQLLTDAGCTVETFTY